MSELINNRAARIETLKRIIQQLHRGADPERVRHELTEIVKTADAGEIAAMEQEIIASGVPVEEIKSMCDLHARVVQDILSKPNLDALPAGHPAETLRRENVAIRRVVSQMREAAAALAAQPADGPGGEPRMRLLHLLSELMDVDKHYRRKEDLFFSILERHGITGPSKVMWAVHDEARKRLKALEEALRVPDATAGEYCQVYEQVGAEGLLIVDRMVDKEEQILLPMMLQTLTEDEWGEIWTQSPPYGWCLVEPGNVYRPPLPILPERTIEPPRDRAMVFPTGMLDFEQLLGLFRTLPVDITFVDADDRVRFFSEGPERIFARSKAIIGRKVQHCHPPGSVHIVDQIVGDFRAGRQSVAEFWIQLHGKFVHIRYFAVRDEQGRYLGTLEVTQDLTRLRALQGERRLLQYDTPVAERHA
ncbi:MAG: DUF438 domain-containing protein [Phycisphaerales bacterium]|nr:DUF438 domain-containing protein [Phycisphaerales bacterium]